MNKRRLVESIHKKVGFPKRETAAILDTAIALMTSALVSEGAVLISSFGKFEVRQRKARKGRNPKTGEPVMIPARKAVAFKASRVLKERINEAHRRRDTG
ncbi:MAG: integration host factor subunit alpha [Deltaproteobacteria bacterium]|nr:integration host factor subunit alpha [Deltaproteobacteria bacterium]